MNNDTKKFFEKLAGVADEEEQQNFEPQLVAKTEKTNDDMFDEGEGQLAIDVYQTADDIVVESAIAGVSIDDMDIEITPESVTIKGKREKHDKSEKRDYLYQECYWGKFSRSVILPQEINPDHATASFKNGILRIVLPKVNKQRLKKLKVRFE
ncbi:MAG: Hsp20/alpha crystallin family protein [Patescibacteria group bacterium]|nr:Hsp20/alpha crystallin family protein [Patescibacteria group bacterium]